MGSSNLTAAGAAVTDLRWSLAVAILILVSIYGCGSGQSSHATLEDCIDFEDLTAGKQLTSPFTTGGSTISFQPLSASSANIVTVQDLQNAGNSSKTELFLHSSRIMMVFDQTYPGVTFNYGDLGGGVFLSVNNVPWSGDDLHNSPASLGGVTITHDFGTTLGHIQGRVTLTGETHTLEIGGRELAVDYFCPLDV